MERERAGGMVDCRRHCGSVVGVVDEARVMTAHLPKGRGQMWFLARHEWRVLSASRAGRFVMAVFIIALGIASVLGAIRAADARDAIREFGGRAIAERTNAGDIRADVAANERGFLALLPPARLSALAVGQGDVYPNYVKVTARSLDALVSGDQIENPLAVASGQFDAAFVILFLYPLLICAISFDLTATERDQGTLRMVLSQPVKMRDLIAGKMLVRAVRLLIPASLIPIAVAALGAPIDGEFLLRASLWAGAVIAYGAIWHGIALLVNARGLTAPANALILAGIWLLFAVVGPSCVNLLIAIRYPMPSRVEAAVQARAATQDATVQGSRQLGQFLQDHPTSGNVGREGMRQFALLQAQRDQRVADRLQAVEVSFNTQLARQRRLASWLSVLSPTMTAQGVLLEVAGTSTTRFDHFRSEAAAFQRQWRAYFEPRVLDAATLTQAEYAAAPAFSYGEEPASQSARRIALPVVAMAIAGFLLIALGFRRYRGYAL
jgi:ABC-2 type transport system permease protein